MKQIIQCKQCHAVIMRFVIEPVIGDRIKAYMIDQNSAQGPWYKGDLMLCRKCRKEFTNRDLVKQD